MSTDPMQRLASAYRIEIDPTVEERHLAEVSTALRHAPLPESSGRIGLRRRRGWALAAAALILAPAAIAVASEGTVPGNALYPVKQVTERIRVPLDEDIVATHRIEELERLIEQDASPDLIDETAGRAAVAVSQLDDPDELGPRLERAREGMRDRAENRNSDGSDPGQPNSGVDEPDNGTRGSTVAPDPEGESAPDTGSVGPESGGADQKQAGSTDNETDRSRDGSGEGAGSEDQSDEESPGTGSGGPNGLDQRGGDGRRSVGGS